MNLDKVINKIRSQIDKETIDLSNLHLDELPEEMRAAKSVRRLNISGNKISVLPDWFQELSSLEVLDARDCNLSALCKGFEKLTNLKSLYLRNNKISEVPSSLKEMENLTTIFISFNQIEKFPDWFFNIDNLIIYGNPVLDPPQEVVARGIDSIRNYIKERENGTEKLYEAKLLILGEGNGGKTTLMNKLLNEDYLVNPFQASTKGIEIQPYLFKSNRKDFRINIWDFGGQEIYHATHQFFLTKRSLYILLTDNRAEDTDFNYWLQTVKLFSDNSPLIIVQNEKDSRKRELNLEGMKERYNNIIKLISFNLATDKPHLRSLNREIHHQVYNLPHIGTELPKIWVDIRKTLELKGKETPYISEADYLSICYEAGMEGKDRAYYLSEYLHDLGVFLHFRDHPVLKRWIILKPDWGTEAVYKVLDNEEVILNTGYFTKDSLKKIWSSAIYSDMHDELIFLMMKFELCYKLDGEETFIAAQLLKRIKPLYEWDNKNNLIIKLSYEFLPKGIITRFIVRLHYHIANQRDVWREGVVLERQNAYAEVIESYGKKEIRIRVRGKYKKELLAIILDNFDHIHKSFPSIQVTKLIPCNCYECASSESPNFFEYDLLREYHNDGIELERCRKSKKQIKIAPLLSEAFGKGHEDEIKPPILYISYCDEDLSYKRKFENHLRALERTSFLKIFDKEKVTPGLEEKRVLREYIDEADVILILVSPNYLNDESNYNSEMSKALDRSENKSCITIPVIIRDCNWQDFPIGQLKPILHKGKSLFSQEFQIDTSLTDATTQVKRSIENYRSISKQLKDSDNIDKETL